MNDKCVAGAPDARSLVLREFANDLPYVAGALIDAPEVVVGFRKALLIGAEAIESLGAQVEAQAQQLEAVRVWATKPCYPLRTFVNAQEDVLHILDAPTQPDPAAES